MCWEGGWECADPFSLLMPALFCVEGFTLPLPPPGDPGFLRSESPGRVLATLGVPGSSAWSPLAPSWPPKRDPCDPTCPYIEPKIPKHGPSWLIWTSFASNMATWRSILCHLGGPQAQKGLFLWTSFNKFKNAPFCSLVALDLHFEALCGPFWPPKGPSWSSFGSSWAHVGLSLVPLGPLLAPFGAHVGARVRLLGLLGALLGLPRAQMTSTWTSRRPT